MIKIMQFGVVILAIVCLLLVFYPKRVSGTLCGPVCPTLGLHSYSQQCFGVKVSQPTIDDYHTNCFGIPYGAKQCYGKPYNFISSSESPASLQDVAMSCDYPKGDAYLLEYCKMNTKYLIPDNIDVQNPRWVECSDIR